MESNRRRFLKPSQCFMIWGAMSLVGLSHVCALGTVGLETFSFLRSASDRPTTNATMIVNPQYKGRGRHFEGEFDFQANIFANNPETLTVEAKSAYVATSRRLMPRHQFSLGRRDYEWSVVDTIWEMGLWSPRFMWDPLRPQRVGLTGAFYEYKSKYWQILAFGSPIGVPERGYPFEEENGKLNSSGGMFPSLPIGATLPGNPEINYNLDFPETSEILLRPSAAVSVKYGRKKGLWLRGSYGIMAMHQSDLAIDTQLALPEYEFETSLKPRFRHHHILTGEGGYNGRGWAVWGSISGESPLSIEQDEDLIYQEMGPALVSSWGGRLQWPSGMYVFASLLAVVERKPSPPESSIEVNLPSRFNYTRAFRFGAGWRGPSPVAYDLLTTYDAQHLSSLISMDLTFEPDWRGRGTTRARWVFGVGTDLIVSTTGEGWIGQYEGNDRVRGTVKYVF